MYAKHLNPEMLLVAIPCYFSIAYISLMLFDDQSWMQYSSNVKTSAEFTKRKMSSVSHLNVLHMKASVLLAFDAVVFSFT